MVDTPHTLVVSTIQGGYPSCMVDIHHGWKIPLIYGRYPPYMVGIYHAWEITPMYGRYPPCMVHYTRLNSLHTEEKVRNSSHIDYISNIKQNKMGQGAVYLILSMDFGKQSWEKLKAKVSILV